MLNVWYISYPEYSTISFVVWNTQHFYPREPVPFEREVNIWDKHSHVKPCLTNYWFPHPTLLLFEKIWLIKVTNRFKFCLTRSRLLLDDVTLLDAATLGSRRLWVWLLSLEAADCGLRALITTGNGVVTSGRRATLKQDSQQVDP